MKIISLNFKPKEKETKQQHMQEAICIKPKKKCNTYESGLALTLLSVAPIKRIKALKQNCYSNTDNYIPSISLTKIVGLGWCAAELDVS